MAPAGAFDGGVNPSWIAWHPALPIAYVCHEDFTAGVEGSVTAWDLSKAEPRLVGRAGTGGGSPCHVCVVPTGRRHSLVLSHYVGGQVSLVPLDVRGVPAASPAAVVAHQGASHVVADRQEAPHPHQAAHDPGTGLIWVCDLGQDRLVAYESRGGGLVEAAELPTSPGFGPRHATFHPGLGHMAVVGELANEVVVYRRGEPGGERGARLTGTWRETGRSTTLPDGWSGANGAAAVVWSADGGRLDVSNRGHDSVAVWTFDAAADELTTVGHSRVGAAPRDLTFTSDGRHAVVAAQGEHRAVVHPVGADGLLGPEVGSLECAYAARVALAPGN
jgi:6-phosphogluconolactonase